MTGKRKTRDFNKQRLKFSERNPRGKNAEWLSFACTKKESDFIFEAIGTAVQQTINEEMPAGTLLARICKEWIKYTSLPIYHKES